MQSISSSVKMVAFSLVLHKKTSMMHTTASSQTERQDLNTNANLMPVNGLPAHMPQRLTFLPPPRWHVASVSLVSMGYYVLKKRIPGRKNHSVIALNIMAETDTCYANRGSAS